MKKQTLGIWMVVSLPWASYALPHQKNIDGFRLVKVQNSNSHTKMLDGKHSEILKIQAIINDEKMKFKISSKQDESRLTDELSKVQLGRFDEFYKQHDFAQWFISRGNAQQ